MKHLKVMLAMLVLVIAACRTVPANVRTAHDLSIAESSKAFNAVDNFIQDVGIRVGEIGEEEVMAAYNGWRDGIDKAVAARAIVKKYLIDTKAGYDANRGYDVAERLLADLNLNVGQIWADWPELNTTSGKIFVARFRLDMARFGTLERKFDDWIRQFKVKG